MTRPDPIRWLWYALGGRLGPRYREWVLHDATCRTWRLRHFARIGVQLLIVTPLILPVNATVAIMVFMSVWNDITIPLYFLTDSSTWTMPLSIYNFYGKYSREWNLIFANLVLTSLPVFILYLFGQKYIVSGLTAGAVKG